MRFRTAVTAVGLSLLAFSAAGAQKRGPELTVGMGALGHETYDGEDSYFWVLAPESFVRLAFYATPKIAIEPDLKVYYWSGEGSSGSELKLGVYIPYYLSGNYGTAGFYLAPGVGISLFKEGNGDSSNQRFYSVEVGKKFRISESTNFRLAGQWFHNPENDDYQSYTNIGLIAGLSVFLK